MNEVLTPFMFNYNYCSDMNEVKVFNFFSRFMHVFLPSFYCDPDFLAVQACLCMYKLLLKYHDPQIAIYLEENNITPEIYAFNWFITLFSSKMPIDLVYKLWIQMIQA